MEERGGGADGYKSKDMGRVFFAFSEQRQNKQSDWNTLGSQTCVAVSLSFSHPFLLFLFLFFYFYVGEKSRDAASKGGKTAAGAVDGDNDERCV